MFRDYSQKFYKCQYDKGIVKKMIESYRFGEIVVNAKKYTTDIIIFPDGSISSWWRLEGHKVLIEDITQILEKKPDVLIIGTGSSGILKIPKDTKNYIASLNINLISEKTKKACKTFNKLKKKGRVAGAFHLTC